MRVNNVLPKPGEPVILMLSTKSHTLFISSYFTLIDGLVQIAVPYDPKAHGKKIRNVKSSCLDVGLAHDKVVQISIGY